MIKRIKKIRSFGIFSNFTSAIDTQDFARFNLIYGWNYSGKTTLSRIFRCFEQQCIPSEFLGSEFEFIDDKGNSLNESLSYITHPVRVFNSDFVEENLKWNNDFEPIFLLGQENIKLQEELENEKETLRISSESIFSLKNSIKDSEKYISDSLTGKAREVKQILSLPDYNRTKLLAIIGSINENHLQHILSQEDFDVIFSSYINKDKKEKIGLIQELSFDTSKLSLRVNNVLSSTVVSKVIERLKDRPVIQEWVKEGLEIHEGQTICEFCGNKLQDELMFELSAHFSDDFDRLLKEIEHIKNSLLGRKLSTKFVDQANLYNEYQRNYSLFVEQTIKTIFDFNQQIDLIIDRLELKKSKPFDKLDEIALEDYTIEINENIKKINHCIEDHNTKTNNFEIEKKNSLDKLLKHYACDYVANSEYFQKTQHVKQFHETILNIEPNIDSARLRISQIEKHLSETSKGADKINTYLKDFFGKDDLKVSVTVDDKFQLHRRGSLAKNLSEGEKTAISFAYFIAKLEDKNTSLSNTIIYVDDPISSLDSNHVFNVYAFIKAKLSQCHQIFISTHNYEFFTILREWFHVINKNNRASFLIERSSNSKNNDGSYIKPLPLFIDKYRSEYVYLFSMINEFNNNPSTDFSTLYGLPNLIRRFLEAFTSFKIPKPISLTKKLEMLIQDPIKIEKTLRFVHQNSHTTSTNSSLQFPNLSECKDVIAIVFEMLQNKDKEHFDCLEQVLNGEFD